MSNWQFKPVSSRAVLLEAKSLLQAVAETQRGRAPHQVLAAGGRGDPACHAFVEVYAVAETIVRGVRWCVSEGGGAALVQKRFLSLLMRMAR